MSSECPNPQKHRHKTRREADAHLAAMAHAGRGELTLMAYKCGDHWHIGNKGRGSLEYQLRSALKLGRKRSRRGRA